MLPGHPYEYGFDPRLVPDKLTEPIRWRRPKTVFVNSMSDLFHEAVPDGYVRTGGACDAAGKLAHLSSADETFRTTARHAGDEARVCRSLFSRLVGRQRREQEAWASAYRKLQASPAKIRFLSIEPLLEDLGRFSLTGINWVIVGGESGAGARPMRKSWVLSIRNQCRRNKIPFFFKQWGGVRKGETGRSLDGKTYDEFPQRPETPVIDHQRCLDAIEEIASLHPAGSFHS